MTKHEIKDCLRAKKLKLTPQRCAIFEMLTGSTDHPTAEDIYRTVKRTYPMISQNTVYYTLSALKKAGLISEVNLGHDHARFDANMDRHHHLVCVSCHEIHDVYDEALDRLSMSAAKKQKYAILGHRVEFYGLCQRCMKRKDSSYGRKSQPSEVTA